MTTRTDARDIRLLLESLNDIMEGTTNPEDLIKQMISNTGKSEEELVAGIKKLAGKTEDTITEGEFGDFMFTFLVQSTVLGYVMLAATAGGSVALGEFGVIEKDDVAEFIEFLKSADSVGPAWLLGLMGLSIIEVFLTIYENVKDLPKAIVTFAQKIMSTPTAKKKVDAGLARVAKEKGILSIPKSTKK